MNGAETVLRTLVGQGVTTCFTNPGTSEMPFVAALDDVPEMRAVLTLFEGVATGAADGYARITGKPAAALLHLGPGLGNGLANLHNAKRANSPMVVLVGDHATHHSQFDSPLQSDIDALAGTVSPRVHRSTTVGAVASDTVAAVRAANGPPPAISTLILPADVSWSPSAQAGSATDHLASQGTPYPPTVEPYENLATAAKALTCGQPAVLLLGGTATGLPGLIAASRIAAATGARLLCQTFPARLTRGAGIPPIERLGYYAEDATAQLAPAKHLVLAGAPPPVAFFAYPDRPSELTPPGCQVHMLAAPHNAAGALAALAELLLAPHYTTGVPRARPALPTGTLTAERVAAAVGALLPEHCIVIDESNTSGTALPAATGGAPPHDWLTLTGGAIGYGLPASVGAALAAADRPVVCLQSDGSAMYTVSALWTHARENLDITTVIYNNATYAILRNELRRLSPNLPPSLAKTRSDPLINIDRPRLDFTALASGMGVPARTTTTAETFCAALREAFAEPGPHLIDAHIP